jgi:hypothetical protein
MKRHCELRIGRRRTFIFGCILGAGSCLCACSASVYPASECKPPPPPLTVPNSPRSQCREVSTEHAKDWPQKYKDVQYAEENAVYRVRAAFSDLADPTQRQLQSEFAHAVAEVNSADGKYLQLVDAAVAAKGEDYGEVTKMLTKALEAFVKFIPDNLKGAQITPGAQKNLEKANAALQLLKDTIKPPPAPAEDGKANDGRATDSNDDNPNPDDNAEIKTY